MTEILEIISTPQILRGLVVGLLVSLCASLLGVSLVLKRYSMIGDGLSHVAFGSLSIAYALGLFPLAVTIPVVMLAAFLLLRLSENSKINGDSGVALIASVSLAMGVICANLGGVNIDVNEFMFGSILLVDKTDLYICVPLALFVIGAFILFYNEIFLVTCDEDFARASGTGVSFYKSVLALLTALTVVVGMRIMGTLLISSLVIFPALTAMRVFKSFGKVVICSAAVSLFSFVMGIAVTVAFDIPAGASIVVANAVTFALFSVVGALRERA